MRKLPDFDPYELLGVDADADEVAIDRAYKARIRLVHPDVAGSAGLHETKRLNVAREWLLDAELRARLPQPSRSWRSAAGGWRAARQGTRPTADQPVRPRGEEPVRPRRPHPSWDWDVASTPRAQPSWAYDPLRDDPLAFDYGSRTDQVRAFFTSLRSLTDDERARLTYSMADEKPGSFDAYRDELGEELWGRSLALHDAVSIVWQEREDEIAPLDFPKYPFNGGGPAIADAYGQWLLLGEELRGRSRDRDGTERLGHTCTWPWEAAVGFDRYGERHVGVAAFLADAAGLSIASAERLARSWQRDMGRFLYGRPGEDWFPGTRDHAKPDLVSARLAAVDASRIEAPVGLGREQRPAFYNGLRLTAYALALGGVTDAGRDYLRPWKEAMDATPSFFDRARYGMPVG